MFSKILGGASLAMMVALVFMWRSNTSLSEELGATQLSLEQAAIANASNVAAINSLRAGLTMCIDQRRVDEEQNQLTVVELERDLEALREQRQEVRVIREEIFRDPSCAELGAIDIAATCPALADSMWSIANGFD